MNISTTDAPNILVIQENICFQIDLFCIEVKAYLGLFADVHYFHVNIHKFENNSRLDEVNLERLGLLRVGDVDGNLNLELQLRQVLDNHKMVAELLCSTEDWIVINCSSEQAVEADIELSLNPIFIPETLLDESEYLEEEFLEPRALVSKLPSSKRILLSYLPEPEKTLLAWLKQDHTLETCLSLAIQVCQFFRYVYQQGWCFVQITPAFVQIGTLIQFFDLTGICGVGQKLSYGLTGDYCACELALGYPIDEQMSTYIVGILLYQSIHHQLPNLDDPGKLIIRPIPRIYQIISICLASFGDRFSLSQLLSILIETRQSYNTPQIRWCVASRSTVGLSPSRLQNEDSYGVKQHYSNQSEALILAVIADGMGGMAQGEIASQFAVKTVLEAAIPISLKSAADRAKWLTTLVQKANESVSQHVQDGGTTLSLVLAVNRELMIAHIGDSRIFLLRNGCICQLSEDHSMVAMLLANGQISYEESQEHPDRSVLLKSLGSKRKISEDYLQDLSRFGSSLSMTLEDGDTLILCSDGIWDLVSMDELAEVFVTNQNLQVAANTTIDQVIYRGAIDNATILVLQCSIEKYYE
ncbi:MAG: protein phosphatase 2C domain-containing protein [Desmonostoc vinosum HA7617-LM4]|jgi:protein phosphatase|nr:protein phosphatase 2C domain-containing protein [Desmonostoc vinosum HA7617-LM4]